MALTDKALVTLAQVQDAVGDDDPQNEATLERLIEAASVRIARYCNRDFEAVTDKAEKLAGYGTQFLSVSVTPLSSITSITYDGTTLDSNDYEIHGDGRGGLIYRIGGWQWTASVQNNITGVDPVPATERRLYTVTYSGGYTTPNQGTSTVPADLAEACITTVSGLWADLGSNPRITGENLLSYSYSVNALLSGLDETGFPTVVRAMLNSYRRFSQ